MNLPSGCDPGLGGHARGQGQGDAAEAGVREAGAERGEPA
jgi:hypothetical protein